MGGSKPCKELGQGYSGKRKKHVQMQGGREKKPVGGSSEQDRGGGGGGRGGVEEGRALEAVSIPQGKPWVTPVPMWRMDSRKNEGSQCGRPPSP